MKFKITALIVGLIINILLVIVVMSTAVEQLSKPSDWAVLIGVGIIVFTFFIEWLVVYPLLSKLFNEITTNN